MTRMQRRALSLSRAGFRHRDIAARWGLCRSAITRRIGRARRAIRSSEPRLVMTARSQYLPTFTGVGIRVD